MECPVCYCSKSATCVAKLECGHALCLSCARKWLVGNTMPDCPLCRAPTKFFSRRTRSQSRRPEATFHLQIMIHSLSVWADADPTMYAHGLVCLCECIIVGNTAVWYRPDMQFLIAHVQRVLELILRKSAPFEHVSLMTWEKRIVQRILAW